MATPLSAASFLAALCAEGLRVVEVGNWRTHNRNHKGSWGPLHGVMIHHTVTKGTGATVRLCRDGHSDLPGPLCHGVIAKDGTVHLVGYGRANHAGSGDADVLRAVINEAPLPPDNDVTTDGNRHFYGFECENLGDGKDPWPKAQLDAIEKVSAALCRAHGWGAGSVIGHLEWQPGKIDPRGFAMQTMRSRVAARLDGHAPPEPPAPRQPTVSLKHIVSAARHDPAAAQGHMSYRDEVLIVEKALRVAGLLSSRWVDGSFGSKTIEAYAAWQRSPAGGGYVGKAADGIPGKDSLIRLGAKHGFTVTP